MKEKQQQGVMLDENISWEEHIRKFEAKLAKILDYYTVQSLYFKKNILKVFILHIFIHTWIMLTLHVSVLVELS